MTDALIDAGARAIFAFLCLGLLLSIIIVVVRGVTLELIELYEKRL